MVDINDKYLPIGTIVTLKNGNHRIMITGFTAMSSESKGEIIYDYVGCPYPEGFTSSGRMLYFYSKDIEKVNHIGYSDSEETGFRELLGEIMDVVNE